MIVKKIDKDKLIGIIYYIAAFLMPGVFLFYLYNINRIKNQLYFSQILIFAGIFAALGLVIYIVLKIISKSRESALFLSVGFWICFWFYRNLFAVVKRIIPTFPSLVFFIIICVSILGVAVLFRFYKPPFKKVQIVFVGISAYLIFLFFFNLLPGVSYNIALSRAREQHTDSSGTDSSVVDVHPLIKTDFYVNESLPSPEIHWVHLDGMMRLDIVEKYFDVSYATTREELTNRGFVINENDTLAWGSTTVSLAAMLSPSLNDNLLSMHYHVAEASIFEEKDRYIDNILLQAGISFDEIRKYELIYAFNEVGYEFKTVSDDTFVFKQHIDISATDDGYIFGIWHESIFGDLLQLLALKTPLVIEPGLKSDSAILNSIISTGEPQLIAKVIPYSHASHFYKYAEENLSRWQDGLTAVHAYPAAHDDAMNHVFEYVDSVLKRNPDAIIILQADHGFHNHDTQRRLLELGYTTQQVLEMNHAMFSAVRIPEVYGGVDAPIHPLNITRVLVNRFVGENYKLLSDDELFRD